MFLETCQVCIGCLDGFIFRQKLHFAAEFSGLIC